ncbi:hypothetical protein HYU09_05165 [Candidatus Woesearchaeota archaeon]|nr:hypothetical protein [Candidatus Woesearchaeota archaeon]
MNSLLPFEKPIYSSATSSSIEQSLEYASNPSIRASLSDFLDDDDGQALTNPLHSPWGEWLTWWDAIDFMENRLDSFDLVRKAFVSQDILYYMEYLPGRGHKDYLFDSADMHFSYEDYEEGIFYLGPAEDEENIAYASSQASYLPMPPDDGIEENKVTEEENNTAANEIPIEADEIHAPDAEKAEAQKENPDILLEAIRMLFVSESKIIAAKAQTL